MATETATAFSDILLCIGTIILGITIGPRKSYRTWIALFITLGIAAGLGAIYHTFARFNNHEFWTLVATSTSAAAFLFVAACLCAVKPNWKWLHWLWPLMALVGFMIGGMLAPFPFYYITAVSAVCVLASALILQKAPSVKARNWIYLGMVIALTGFAVQGFYTGTGFFNHNAVFHYLQLTSNFAIWNGARKT